MANNRITYATAQLAVKDNKADATTQIDGWLADAVLASGITASETGTIDLVGDVSGIWPAAGQIKIKSADGTTEYLRYTSFIDANSIVISERGTGGSTAQAHQTSDIVRLVGWEVPLGVQSVSIGTTFNLEDVFTLGQLDAYENVEGIPEVEVSIDRVFDGTKPLYLMVTDPDFTTLKGRTSDYKADLALSVYPDTQDSATGTADSTVVCSGMFISSWSASFVTDGNFTESVTLVGNDKTWGGEEGVPSGFFPVAASYSAPVVGSGVQRSENFNRSGSTLPADVPADDRIQSIEVSVDITREDIFELGSKTPFTRVVSFPVTVTTTIEAITSEGDKVNALGNGADNLVDRQITLVTDEGLNINLGGQNKLASVQFEGFDAGGGNGTATFEYTNSNSLTITHTGFADPFDTNTDNV